MTSEPGQGVTYFSRLDAEECWALLAEAEVGRLAWHGADGIVVVPVNYRVSDSRIVFQTADGSSLSRLAEPTEVAFEVDDIDGEAIIGWSVLVQGTTSRVEADADKPISWLDGERSVWIAVTPGAVSGRVMSGTKRS